jgi:hypothetical protein
MSEFKFQINSKGYLVNRESFDLEYKQSFHFGDSLIEYVRSMVGMANNRGGKIIFGIQDSPRKPIGLKNDKFATVDTTKINNVVSEYFSHEFDWELTSIEFNKSDNFKLERKRQLDASFHLNDLLSNRNKTFDNFQSKNDLPDQKISDFVADFMSYKTKMLT